MSAYDADGHGHVDADRPTRPSIRVFGGIAVDDIGGPVSIGGPRQRRLLALLVLRAGSVVDIDWLAEYLWDDEDRPEATAPALRTYVSRMRSAFPEAAQDWIATESEGYRLAAPPDAVEHLRFAALRRDAAEARARQDPLAAQQLLTEALALWRGDPFRELADLEPAEAEIERLRLDRLDMMEERWEAALALGRHTQITGELGAFAAEHGERDRAVRQYALALHRGGRTTDALEVVREHSRVLVDEFGLDPSTDIAELERALLEDDPALLVQAQTRPLRAYELVEEIGAGSFAIVWRGTQPSVGRDVAIKQIRRELATQPAFIRRFEAEAHLVARIEHPHIVPLIDYWRDPDSAYLVMRWLRGGTLERRLDDGPMTLDETLSLARQIGGALSAAHAHGVIHRDVKTANILFDETGNAFLTDFGIALEATVSSGPEAALSPGTPAYSSPEQLRQEPLGPSSDVFSLGVMLFECLAGTLPFGGVSAVDELRDRQLNEPYPALSELLSDVPGSVSDAIARATAKDPAQRFPTVAEFVAALETAPEPVVRDAPATEELSEELSEERENPYFGLLAFDDVSADRFFGRERLVAQLVDRLSGTGTGSRCLVIVGPSGSGKSSLAYAGLLPAIRENAVPGSEDWFTTTLTLGDDPFESLEAALLRIAVDPPPTLLDQLRSGRRGILRGVRRCLPSEQQRLFVLIDQFEELFVGRSSQDADEFLDALAVAVTDPDSPLRLAITLRADYYGQPLEHPTFAQVLDAATVNVTPLAGDELERAIVEPARALGVEYEPGLVTRIAAETTGQPSPLPLLQYTLTELFERRNGRVLTAAAYDDIGGLSGALSARAEALYREADDEQRDAIRRVFGRLIDPTEETADLRRRPRVADLGADPATAWVLERYGAARLITFDRDAVSREPTVEVAHEALLREWPRLVRWLQEDLELLRAVDALNEAASRWDEGGRAEEDLLRGSRLERAAELVSTSRSHLRSLDLAFVAASAEASRATAEAEQRGKRRTRLLAGGVSIALVVALVAGGIAVAQVWRADEEAQAATAAQRQAEVTTLLGSAAEADPSTAILLALEAQRREPGVETDQALLTALARASGGRTVVSHEAIPADDCTSTWPGWVSRDGTTQTAAVEGMAVTRDLASGKVTERFDMPGDGCSEWYEDAVSGSRYALVQGHVAPLDQSIVGDRLWLGSGANPWQHEVTVDHRSWVSGADGLAGSRLLLKAPGGVSLVDVSSATRVGPPLYGLDEDPVAALNDEGTLVAFATPADSSKDRAGTVVILDAVDGAERSRTPVAGHVTSLHFDRAEPRALAGTADGALIAIELDGDGGISSERQASAEAIMAIDSRPAGGTMVLLGGTPSTMQMIGAPGGGAEAAIEVGGLQDVALRPDGSIASMDAGRRIEIVEFGGQAMEADSVEIVGIEPVSAEDYVEIREGRAGIIYSQQPTRYAIDLDTGVLETPTLATGDGTRFPMASGPILLDGGHAAISRHGEVALWRGGKLIDRLTLGGPTASFEGWTVIGARAAVGVVTEEGTRQMHLLDLSGDTITDLLAVEPREDIFHAGPTDDAGLFIVNLAGSVRVYGSDGMIVGEYELGFDPTLGSLIFSFDGSDRIAYARPNAGLGSTQVDIFDLGAGGSRTFLTSGSVANLSFARDGGILVLQGEDGSIRLHDVSNGVTSPVIWGGSDAAYGVPWYDEATDSMWVAAADRIARLPLGREDQRSRACQRVGRDLSSDEWARFVPGDGPRIASCAEQA